MKMTAEFYDVVAVNLNTRRVTALFGERKTLKNAEAIVMMAVGRRGVDEEFYAEVPTGKFKVGDDYTVWRSQAKRLHRQHARVQAPQLSLV